MEGDAQPKCHVVAVPYPGRGHVNPMMNLCKLIAVHRPETLFTFILTEEWYGFIAGDPKPENLRFATVPNVIPSEIGRANDFAAFFRATQTELEAPVEALLDRLDRPKPNVIIHDTYLPWVVSLGNRKNIPVASLFTMSAATFSVFLHWDLLVQNGHSHNPNISELVNYLPGVPSIQVSDLPTPVHGKGKELVNDVLKVLSMVPKAQYLLFTSVYELEASAIDAIKQTLSSLPIYTIGPAIPYFSAIDEDKTPSVLADKESDRIIKWLDSQPESSVIYISQGSFLSVSSSQQDEIVAGVHASGVRFLWVTRGEESQFRRENNNGGVGCLVVRWCNQFEVLRHRAVGGFWSHCGWNSTKEAAFAGVPVLTFPIFWDQTTNSKIIVEDWKIGVKVQRGDGGLVGRGEIGELLKRFMDLENAEMKEMRRRAKVLQQMCHTSTEKGGSSYVNIDAFINEIS